MTQRACEGTWNLIRLRTGTLLQDGCIPSDGGDKDARDSVQMHLEHRLREGQEDGSVIGRQVGTFERHTKVSEHG